MLASLNFLKISDGADRRTGLDDFKKSYREERLRDQIEYFARNAALPIGRRARYQHTVTYAVAIGLVRQREYAAGFVLVEEFVRKLVNESRVWGEPCFFRSPRWPARSWL